MIFTMKKALNDWGKVLRNEDYLSAAILNRDLEGRRFIHANGPCKSGTAQKFPESALQRSGFELIGFFSASYGFHRLSTPGKFKNRIDSVYS